MRQLTFRRADTSLSVRKRSLPNAEKQKAVLLPLHWSISAYPATGLHPQKVINQQVVNMIFFKQAVNINKINIEQISRLQDFKREIGQKALYADYNSIDEFKRILEDKLSLCINDNFIKEKIVINELEWNEVKDDTSHEKLSDYDKARLKSWTSVDNPDFFQAHFMGGKCVYGLGASNQYEIKNGREKIEWDSFFEKLLNLGLIRIRSYDKHGYPVYQLKEAAYQYVESHNL